MFDLTGRVAVVTGGYKGLGLGIAQGLQSAGAQLVFWARDEDRMAAVAEPMGATAVACDVSDELSVSRATQATVERHGRVDIMVANAGIPPEFEWLPDVTLDKWNEVLSVNLTGVFLTAQAAARDMVKRAQGGKIIVVSSARAAVGTAHGPAYAAGKAGVEGLVRSLAVALARHDVQVNAIRAGWVATDLTAQMPGSPGGFEDALIRAVPARRWGKPSDLAGIAVYLASRESAFHTGDVITVDGGFACRDPLDPREWGAGPD